MWTNKHTQITDQKEVMDARTVQQLLMKTRIPQKRTNMQRKKLDHDDEDSDDDMNE